MKQGQLGPDATATTTPANYSAARQGCVVKSPSNREKERKGAGGSREGEGERERERERERLTGMDNQPATIQLWRRVMQLLGNPN